VLEERFYNTGSFMAYIYYITAVVVLLNSLCQRLDKNDRLDISKNDRHIKESNADASKKKSAPH